MAKVQPTTKASYTNSIQPGFVLAGKLEAAGLAVGDRAEVDAGVVDREQDLDESVQALRRLAVTSAMRPALA